MPANANIATVISIAVLYMVSAGQAAERLVRISIDRDAIFTPGQVRIEAQLSGRAELSGSYQAKLTAFLAGLIVREQTAGISREVPAAFVVPFPKVPTRGEVRCRIELSLDGEFLEAGEYPVVLWPPAAPLDGRRRPANVWVLDTSGGLQRLFHELDVNTVDAAYQGVRDFVSPSAVFIGEFSQAQAMQLILTRVWQMPKPPIVTFLRQKEFPEALEIEMVNDPNSPRSIVCDMNAPLLRDLTRRDMLTLVSEAVSIRTKAKEGFTESFAADRTNNRRAPATCLSTLKMDGRRHVFCQLPVMDPCDPRQVTLLRNIVEFSSTR